MRTTLVLAFTVLVSCHVSSPATLSVKQSHRAECQGHCSTLDMSLGAMVIMGNSAGCVCVTASAADGASGQSPPAAKVAVSAGAAAAGHLVKQQAEAAAQHQQQQQQHHLPGSP